MGSTTRPPPCQLQQVGNVHNAAMVDVGQARRGAPPLIDDRRQRVGLLRSRWTLCAHGGNRAKAKGQGFGYGYGYGYGFGCGCGYGFGATALATATSIWTDVRRMGGSSSLVPDCRLGDGSRVREADRRTRTPSKNSS